MKKKKTFSSPGVCFLFLENYSIPPMTTIVIYPYILHRNEEIYKNSEEFKPERFLTQESQSNNLFTYLPFSAGVRNCIGKFKYFEWTILFYFL